MPTLLTSVFANPNTRGVARSSAVQDSFNVKPFQPPARFLSVQHSVPHSINDTVDYVRLSRCSLSRDVIAEYVHLFVTLSDEMRKLDEALPKIMATPNKPQTFPNVVVDLARLIPEDADGTVTARKNFLITGLSRSLTLRQSLSEYDMAQNIETAIRKPSAAWVLRRALRSFSTHADQAAFIEGLSDALPQHAIAINNIHGEFMTIPKLRRSDLAPEALVEGPESSLRGI